MASHPEFKFTVIKSYRDPMTRLVHEAVRIPNRASLNSRGEWGGYKIARLKIDKPDWKAKKDLEIEEIEKMKVSDDLIRFKSRVVANAQQGSNNHFNTFYRKRTMCDQEPSDNGCETPVPAKRLKVVGVKTGSGKWNPGQRDFSKKTY